MLNCYKEKQMIIRVWKQFGKSSFLFLTLHFFANISHEVESR